MTEPLDQPVTVQDAADFMTAVLIEVVAALSPSSARADDALEDLAGHLLTMSGGLTNPRQSLLIRTTAQQLIQTETGAQE